MYVMGWVIFKLLKLYYFRNTMSHYRKVLINQVSNFQDSFNPIGAKIIYIFGLNSANDIVA